MRRSLLGLTAAVLAALTLGACSTSGGDSAQRATDGGGSVDSGVAPTAAAPSGVAEPDKASGGGSDTALAPDLNSAKIRTADLTVDITGARNIAAKADAAADIATRVGGEVDSDDRASGRHATSTMRLRVPPASLTAVLTALSKLGAEKSRHSATTDVTEQVADVTSRVASAQQAIARLRALYDDATKVSDVIAIESELSGRESDLESLQAQQRALSKQTEMASVTLYLRTAAATTHDSKSDDGFTGGFSRGWDKFVDAAGWLATAAGAVLPFAIVLLLLAGALRLLRPRLGRRSSTPPVPSSE